MNVVFFMFRMRGLSLKLSFNTKKIKKDVRKRNIKKTEGGVGTGKKRGVFTSKKRVLSVLSANSFWKSSGKKENILRA